LAYGTLSTIFSSDFSWQVCPPPKRADTYPDWLNAMDRVMECRARFPALDEHIYERDGTDPMLVQEDEALSAEYDAACRAEARAFADITGIDVA
jgi:hypothetical protein